MSFSMVLSMLINDLMIFYIKLWSMQYINCFEPL